MAATALLGRSPSLRRVDAETPAIGAFSGFGFPVCRRPESLGEAYVDGDKKEYPLSGCGLQVRTCARHSDYTRQRPTVSTLQACPHWKP